MKQSGAHTAELSFDKCRVPVANCIGEEGQGFIYQMQQFQNERLVSGLGAAAGGFEVDESQTIEELEKHLLREKLDKKRRKNAKADEVDVFESLMGNKRAAKIAAA